MNLIGIHFTFFSSLNKITVEEKHSYYLCLSMQIRCESFASERTSVLCNAKEKDFLFSKHRSWHLKSVNFPLLDSDCSRKMLTLQCRPNRQRSKDCRVLASWGERMKGRSRFLHDFLPARFHSSSHLPQDSILRSLFLPRSSTFFDPSPSRCLSPSENSYRGENFESTVLSFVNVHRAEKNSAFG